MKSTPHPDKHLPPPPVEVHVHLSSASPSSPTPETDTPGGQKFDSRKPAKPTQAFKTRRRFGTGKLPKKF